MVRKEKESLFPWSRRLVYFSQNGRTVRGLCFHSESWLFKAYESFPAFTSTTSSRRIYKMGKEPAPVNTDSVGIYLHWLTQSHALPISQAYWRVTSFTEYHCHYEADWSASIWEPQPALTQHQVGIPVFQHHCVAFSMCNREYWLPRGFSLWPSFSTMTIFR